ncbi:MAG: FliI/YscN family ATPase, partial [Endozoicomonas sp.]
VGEELLGRVIDGIGRPLDGKGALANRESTCLDGQAINPLKRRAIEEPLNVGIRAINGLLTVGKGQRLGLFAGSGVGKSVLLGMMTRFTSAEVTVVGLVGERGREVREFIEQSLGEEGLKKAVVVAAPADSSPVMRLRASRLCHRIAEHFRDQGKDVLLLMDSLTRFAQAQREIALAVGEPPATKGYPPSVFSMLPSLVERAGNGEGGQGSMTAFYTVLSEGDDQQDPVADSARAILDGHFVLSRELAESGHYPAIDVEQSVSRVMPQVVSEHHMLMAQNFRKTLALYNRNRELMTLGAYRKGTDAAIDKAVAMYPALAGLLTQGMNESAGFDSSIQRLQGLFPGVVSKGS